MVTIKEVAKMADVSTATVSRIINNKAGANIDTEKRVREAIKKLEYEPNNIARSLSNRSSNLIALIIPNLNNPYFADLVNIIETSAYNYGYKLYLCNSNDSKENISYFLKNIVDNYIQNVIINSLAITKKDIEYLEKHNVNVITIDRTNLDNQPNSISVDHFEGSFLATKHLVNNCGCEHILFISGEMNEQSSINRFRGYQKAIQKFTKTHTINLLEGDFTYKSGYELALKKLKTENNIQGIICANDAMAIGVINACYELGISIPNSIQIIGYDNCVLSQYSTPSLTTVNQLDPKIGQMIMESIKENKAIQFEYIPELIIRKTTKI